LMDLSAAGYPSIRNPSSLAAFYRQQLLTDVLPFWFPRSVDTTHGGFLHCFDAEGRLVDSDKSVWAQGRMSWMLLTLYNTWEQRSEWLDWGRGGLEFLMKHGFDRDGQMFFTLTRDGHPLRKRRYVYSEAFMSIAAAAMYRATGESRWGRVAVDSFRFFLDWNFVPGRMPPKFTDHRPMLGLAPRMIAITTAQSLRADLGEGAGNFGLDLNGIIDEYLNQISEMFVDHDREAVLENVTSSGIDTEHFDGRLLNPGHAIEAAWFVMEEGRYRQDRKWVDLGCLMLEYSWRRGWDTEHGGLCYYRDLLNYPVQEYWQEMKFWWPHDEAMIATAMAYCLTGQDRYADWHDRVVEWSFRHFGDPERGEWYGYLHRDGRVSTTLKGNHWKSFFHHPRMLWKCCQLLDSCSANHGIAEGS
jgi:N-acylglucosamine 2-epimerase